MDPNANLDRQLDLVNAIRHEQNLNGVADMHDVEQLCELVEALDHWITGGGFLPARWQDALVDKALSERKLTIDRRQP